MKIHPTSIEASGMRFAIVVARFNHLISVRLLEGCAGELERRGAAPDDVEVFWVPGAFEIPGAIALAADSYDGFVALGCVIRGETTHYDYVCGESARGLMDLSINRGLAIGYGIVTTENGDQAWERAAVDRKNKGKDAALAALRMVELRRRFAVRP